MTTDDPGQAEGTGLPVVPDVGRAMDEYGLPLQSSSKAVPYLVLTGCLFCEAASAAVFVINFVVSVAVGFLWAGVVLAFASFLVLERMKVSERLGRTGRRFVTVAYVLAVVGEIGLLIAIAPHVPAGGGA